MWGKADMVSVGMLNRGGRGTTARLVVSKAGGESLLWPSLWSEDSLQGPLITVTPVEILAGAQEVESSIVPKGGRGRSGTTLAAAMEDVNQQHQALVRRKSAIAEKLKEKGGGKNRGSNRVSRGTSMGSFWAILGLVVGAILIVLSKSSVRFRY